MRNDKAFHEDCFEAAAPIQNPENACPPDILGQQKAITVPYRDSQGDSRSGIIEVNALVVADAWSFFNKAFELHFPIEKVVRASDEPYRWDDEKLMAANTSSGFNYRVVAGTNQVSKHGLGLAFDVNSRLNPYIRYQNGETITAPEGAVWDVRKPGTLYAAHPLVKYMESLGWKWGGNWKPESGRVDYQHFEKIDAR